MNSFSGLCLQIIFFGYPICEVQSAPLEQSRDGTAMAPVPTLLYIQLLSPQLNMAKGRLHQDVSSRRKNDADLGYVYTEIVLGLDKTTNATYRQDYT